MLSLNLAELEERVSVLEERTVDNDLRTEDLEGWRVKIDEHVEAVFG